MHITIDGTYKNGKIELSEPPPGITEADVLVTFVKIARTDSPAKMMVRGMFAGEKESREEDFESAQWQGEPEFWGDG